MSSKISQWLFLLFFLSTVTVITQSKEVRVVCYYTNWSAYRPGTAKFVPQNINPYLCTHLIYAFGGFTKENTLKPFDKYADIEKGGYAKFTGLKTYNKNLKTMLAIGGWNEGSSRFSPMVASADRRKELVKNAIKFLRQNHFDGLDLDWEYPNFRDGGKPRDKDNYAQLVQELREEFDRESEKTGRPRLLLTMAVPAGIEYINKGYDVPKLNKYLDWMNILNYDYHSAYEPSVNHHSPLYALEEPSEYNYEADLNIDYTIKHYLKLGADPGKLVMGIPTYGRSYTLFNPDANELGAPADGPGDMGEATRENGFLSYYEICERVRSEGWAVVQPEGGAMGPYAFKGAQWVAYDDEAIARTKAQYVAAHGLGGVMFWSIDNDDFRGACHGRAYPIVEAAKEALVAALAGEEGANALAGKTKPGAKPKESVAAAAARRRNRVRGKEAESTSRASARRKEGRRTTSEASVQSSLELVTPSWTTPAPPSTPEQGGGFKCEDEGFYPHPKDCKKYFWCLNGAGDSGIIAHAFTCPAGLYFNKAADSCDYTRNVLCNKKLPKSPSTTTTAAPSSTTTKRQPSTARTPPKITAATSRTTAFRTTTTTTQAYDDEYEEYDDEEENKNSEEDPKVIKELLDLIKKAGGIEELEKQLKLQETGSGTADSTTKSSIISKSLVERVLGKATAKNKYLGNRNSGGPQNEGLSATEKGKEEKKERGRLQYTSISRQRPQQSDDKGEEVDKSSGKSGEKVEKNRSLPGYVNIRRERPSTSESSIQGNGRSEVDRNKILGEEAEEEEEEEEVEDNKKSTPQYVNIRRQRPSTTTEATTKYTILRRGTTTTTTTEEPTDVVKNDKNTTTAPLESKYKILRRGTTTTTTTTVLPSTTTTEAKNVTVRRRGTTTPEPIQKTTTNRTTTTTELDDIETTTAEAQTDSLTLHDQSPINTKSDLESVVKQPELLEPRPFSLSTTTTNKPNETSATTRKTPFLFRVGGRRKPSPAILAASSTSKPVQQTTKRVPTRRKYPKPLESQEVPRPTTKAPNRYRFVSRRPISRSTTPKLVIQVVDDQNRESSNQQEEESNITTELSDFAIVLNNLQHAPLPSTTLRAKSTQKVIKRTRLTTTTNRPLTTPHSKVAKKPPQPQDFNRAVSLSDYNYYDSIYDTIIPKHSKVLLHGNGVIECLDQGSFPHPISCKKFISCAKMENGVVLGWEYTCPKNLSFDPIGGMCNWATELGCNE